MADTQNPMVKPATPPSPKKKHNPLVPVLIVFAAVVAFLAVWYLAVK